MPALAIAAALRMKPGMPAPGISNARTSATIARTAADGCSFDGSSEDVAVEDHVEVLVGGDPDHDLVGDRVLRVAAGVAMRDPRRELLEGDVREPAERVGRVVLVALLELRHPPPLERDRVDVPGDVR